MFLFQIMKSAYSYKYYHNYVIQYDFLNVFHYRTPQELPKLQKFIVAFNQLQLSEFFCLFTFLQLLTSKSGKVKAQSFNSQKSKQKSISAIFVLKGKLMLYFLSKLCKEVFSFQKSKIKLNLKRSDMCGFLTYKIDKLVSFNLIKNNYMMFKKLNDRNCLYLTLLTNTKRFEEFVFLLCSYKLIQSK